MCLKRPVALVCSGGRFKLRPAEREKEGFELITHRIEEGCVNLESIIPRDSRSYDRFAHVDS